MPGNELNTEVTWATENDTNGAVSGVDVPEPHVTWDIPDGQEVIFRGGAPIVLDAQTTSGNGGPSGGSSDPARSTRMAFAWREPGDPLGHYRTFTQEIQITPFNQLSLSEQQSGDNADRRRVVMDPDVVEGRTMTFEDVDTIALLVDSPDDLEGDQIYVSVPAEVREA